MKMKSNAKILDATSGNRLMWQIKDSPLIYFIDIEGGLEVQPDKVVDCTKTGFEDGCFNMIFFDPPHGWGKKLGNNIYTCRTTEEFIEYRKKYDLNRWGNKPIYYGLDKYQSKSELLSFIHKAQKEFYRILVGLLPKEINLEGEMKHILTVEERRIELDRLRNLLSVD